MGHKRQGKPRRRADMDVGDVLAGRVRVDVEDLLDLIDAVNPTNRDLPAAETRRRYAEKSALQSLLLRRYTDEIAVETEPGDDGVVLLRHRLTGRDACHAVIDDLEPEARSWVRLQLDTAGDGEPAAPIASRAKAAPITSQVVAPADDRPSGPASLVRRGRERMEEYDYEEARACFEAAVRDTGGAADAVLPLLELLVDHLAAYEDALTIAGAMPKVSIQSREVRVLLALAAARAGRLDDADRFMPGASDPRLVEVQLALAGAAIRDKRFSAAREHLARARELDPGDAGLAARDRDLAQAEAAAMADDERALEDVWAREDDATTEARAEELLRRWPASKIGRQILAEISGRRRAAELAEVTQRAEEAAARGALDEAIALWRRAATLGGDAIAVQDKIEAAEIEARRKRDAALVDEAVRLLDAGEVDAGLAACWRLDPKLQARVREARPSPQLARLSALSESVPEATEAAAISAVRALGEAVALHGAGQVEAAARALAPCVRLLAAIPEARRILDDERERLAERRREAALAGLRAARTALDRGDAATARRELGALDASLLPGDRRPEIEALEAALRVAEGVQGRAARFEALLTAGDLLGVRDAARENAASTDGEEQESWRERADDLAARVRREWRLVVVEGQEVERIGVEEDRYLCAESATMMTLAPDGKSALYARICGHWIFLREIDVASSRVTRAVALRAPVELDGPASIGVEDGTAIVASGDCRLLEIDVATWEIRRWLDLRGLFPRDHTIEDVTVAPGRRHVWVTASRRHPSFRTETHVVDVEGRRVARNLGDLAIRYDTVPSVPPRVAAVSWDHSEITLLDERGRVESRTRVPGTTEVHVVAPLAGTGRFALCVTLDDGFEGEAADDAAVDDMEAGDFTLHALSWAPGEGAGPPLRLMGSDSERPASAVWSETAGLLFVTHVEDADTAHLSALRPDGDGFAEAYRIRLPGSHKLIGDGRGHRAALVTSDIDGGVQITALGSAAPDAALPGSGAGREAHLNLRLFGCGWPPEAISARAQVLHGILDAATPEDRTRFVSHHLERHADDPELVVAMARALGYLHERKRGRALERYYAACEERGLCVAQLAVLRAQSEALRMKWKEARRILEAVSPEELDGMNLQHYRHLLGAARYLDGDVPGARAAWTELAGADDACLDAGRLLPLVAPLPDAAADADLQSSAALRLRCAIRDADAAIARGDVAAAVRILDRPMVFCEGEAQSFGRLAAVYLDLPCPTPGAGYRKALVLAECATGGWIDEYRYRIELQLEGAHWGRERLEQVKAKAAEWIEAWRRAEC